MRRKSVLERLEELDGGGQTTGMEATCTNDTTLKKQINKLNPSSSFNSGNTLDRDGQCSGLILEGNILH